MNFKLAKGTLLYSPGGEQVKLPNHATVEFPNIGSLDILAEHLAANQHNFALNRDRLTHTEEVGGKSVVVSYGVGGSRIEGEG